MSVTRGNFIEYKCMSDCLEMGCPGHKVRSVYHHSSDTLSFEIDGKDSYIMDPNLFSALVEIYWNPWVSADQLPPAGERVRVWYVDTEGSAKPCEGHAHYSKNEGWGWTKDDGNKANNAFRRITHWQETTKPAA